MKKVTMKKTAAYACAKWRAASQLCAKPQHYALLKQLERVQEVKLSAAAMETLAIVAFKQPVTRGEMEAIRGVKVDGVVNTLLEYGLICEAGRKEALGRDSLRNDR